MMPGEQVWQRYASGLSPVKEIGGVRREPETLHARLILGI